MNDKPIETRVGREPVRSVELGMEGPKDGSRPKVQSTDGTGLTADFDNGSVELHESDRAPRTRQAPTPGAPASEGDQRGAGEGAGDVAQDDASGGQDDGGEDQGVSALPEFNASDPAVIQQYDAAYLKDGGPNLETLSGEWWKTAKRTADGSWEGALTEGTYAYLEGKGYSKDLVKGVEAGQVALQVQKETTLFGRAGGEQHLRAAIAWAQGGGYTDAQRGRYMAAISGTDLDAAGEQIDILMSRHQKATGKGAPAAAKPQRTTATAGGGSSSGPSGGAKGYANYAEYSAAVRKARSTSDQVLLNETRERLKASPWYGGGEGR